MSKDGIVDGMTITGVAYFVIAFAVFVAVSTYLYYTGDDLDFAVMTGLVGGFGWIFWLIFGVMLAIPLGLTKLLRWVYR
jgi:FtsH-binding integral membrane protein